MIMQYLTNNERYVTLFVRYVTNNVMPIKKRLVGRFSAKKMKTQNTS
jgi:hypothetical protein